MRHNLLIFSLPLLSFLAVLANDSSFYAHGGEVYPVNETGIKLDYEMLTIDYDARPEEDRPFKDGYVDVVFFLRNTGEAKTVTIGFPEKTGAGPEQDGEPSIFNFTAAVDGRPVDTVYQILAKPNRRSNSTRCTCGKSASRKARRTSCTIAIAARPTATSADIGICRTS